MVNLKDREKVCSPSRRKLLLNLYRMSIFAFTVYTGKLFNVVYADDFIERSASKFDLLRLTRNGSNRGTAYSQGNKILSLKDGSQLITYLEADGDNVLLILEQVDQTLKSIRRMIVGTAAGNHGGASIAIDSNQILHIVYGPHAGPMQYRRSKKAFAWFDLETEQKFGNLLTYPSLAIDSKNRLWVAARNSNGGKGNKGTIEVWSSDSKGTFHRTAIPMVNREFGYSAFSPSLHIDTLGRLHLLSTVHEGTDELLYGRYQAVSYLFSDDAGKTWKNSHQKILELPATVEQTGVIYEGGMTVNKILTAGLCATNANGQVYAHFHVERNNQSWNRSSLVLAKLLDNGVWRLYDLNKFCKMPINYEFCDPGVMCMSKDTVRFACNMQNVTNAERNSFSGVAWGHESNRVAIGEFNLTTLKGHFNLLPRIDNLSGPYWLPNMQRQTKQGEILSPPNVVIYTRGNPSGGYKAGKNDIYIHRFS